MVAASFRDSTLSVNALVAMTPEMACATAVREICRQTNTDADLAGVMAVELQPDFMRAALRAMEGEEPPGRVISLVPSAAGQPPMAAGAETPSFGGMGSRDDEPPAA